MDDSAAATPVEWREWGEPAFEAARAADRPVLLSVSARWCGPCHGMDRETYDDPRVAAAIHDGFVPVRVDADRRPRVRERYNAGGFPATVFAAPGGEILSAAGYLDADGMRQVLDRVREAWAERGADAGRVPRALREPGTPAGDPAAVEAYLAGQLAEQFDERHAGWGTDAKFPLPGTVRFALKRDRRRARSTLDAVRDHLLDADGGCYRYAAERGWSAPAREKLLGTNAAVLRAFADAYLHTGDGAYLEPATAIRDYLASTLWTGRAFGGSQSAEDVAGEDGEGKDCEGEDGESEARSVRADASADRPTAEPPVDGTAFADGNALAADALLALAAYTDDDVARRYAERTLSFLADELVADSGVVTHFVGEDDGGDGDARSTGDAAAPDRCLLADQAAVARAFATATAVLGPGYLGTARAAADAAVERLRDDGGAFRDGPAAGPGLLDRSLRPVDDNARMADALVDLHVLTGEAAYRGAARDAVAAFAGAADRMGVQVAGYGTAAARVADPPLTLLVATDPGSDLHRAALRMADHEKVVVPTAGRPDGLRPDLDLDPGGAYLLAGGDGDRAGDDASSDRSDDGLVGPATAPADLADLVAERAE